MLPRTVAARASTRSNPYAARPATRHTGSACARSKRQRIVCGIVVLVSSLLATVSACSSKRTLSLEGIWTDKDRPTARFLFRSDGTGRLTDDCSPPNLDIGSGTEFRWKLVGAQLQASFKSAGRECTGKLQDKVLVIEPADSLRYGDGHYLSMPKTLIWFPPTR